MKTQVNDRDFFQSNETKLLLTLPTGSRIEFKSGEKPDNLYGDDVYAAVIDEASRMREESWYANNVSTGQLKSEESEDRATALESPDSYRMN